MSRSWKPDSTDHVFVIDHTGKPKIVPKYHPGKRSTPPFPDMSSYVRRADQPRTQ